MTEFGCFTEFEAKIIFARHKVIRWQVIYIHNNADDQGECIYIEYEKHRKEDILGRTLPE